MPRAERRRWWLEPTRGEGFVLRNLGTTMCQRMRVESDNRERAIVALWRLVRWLRLRLTRSNGLGARAMVECDIRACMKHSDDAAYSRLLLDADAAVLEARVSEERMREERDELAETLTHFDASDYDAGSGV